MVNKRTILLSIILCLIITISVGYFYNQTITDRIIKLESNDFQYNKKIVDTENIYIEEIKKNLKDLEDNNSKLKEEIDNLKIKNNEIIESAEACKMFAYNYFLFFEKANELFANGTTGCAVKYIKSGNPSKFPSGCFRFDTGKGTNEWRDKNWYQNPDKKYYDSLSYYYYQYLKFQNQCTKTLEKIQ
jgi:hypothetical protein